MKIVKANDLHSNILKEYKRWLNIIGDIVKRCNKITKTDNAKNYNSSMTRVPDKLSMELPEPKEINEVFRILDKHNNPKSSILIVDDIDFDGTGAGYITYRYLKQHYKAQVNVLCNDKHGFSGEDIEKLDSKYDLIIIVDSSSTLIETYKESKSDILILDHHNIPNQQPTITKYDNNEVVICNSTLTPELKSISAGMLCYIILHKYYLKYLQDKECKGKTVEDELGISDIDGINIDINTLDLFEIGAVTNISDIVPVDETVMSILLEYLIHRNKETELITCLLRYATDPIDKYRLQWRIIPLINYTRRLSDTSTINLIYYNSIKASIPYLLSNHTKGKSILQQMKSQTLDDLNRYTNFVYVDISKCYETLGGDIPRFTGLFCNVLQNDYDVPSVVSVNTDDGIKLSIRSNRVDSLVFFNQYPNLKGGGHKSACGFHVKTYEELESILSDYDKFLEGADKEETVLVKYENIIDIMKDMDLFKVSLYNEMCFSNLTPLIFVLENLRENYLNLKPISNNEYDLQIEGEDLPYNTITISFVDKYINLYKPLIIKPLYDQQDKNKFKLLCRNI